MLLPALESPSDEKTTPPKTNSHGSGRGTPAGRERAATLPRAACHRRAAEEKTDEEKAEVKYIGTETKE